MEQLTINFTGEDLAKQGIGTAIEHADSCVPDWSKQAYNFGLTYCRTRTRFMAEDMRLSSDGVIRRLQHNGIIRCVGISKVKNITAHSANASVWEVVDNVL